MSKKTRFVSAEQYYARQQFFATLPAIKVMVDGMIKEMIKFVIDSYFSSPRVFNSIYPADYGSVVRRGIESLGEGLWL